MLVTLRQWNAELGQIVTVQIEILVKVKSIVSTYNDLLTVEKSIGDGRVTFDTKQLYVYDGHSWLPQGHVDLDDFLLDLLIQERS